MRVTCWLGHFTGPRSGRGNAGRALGYGVENIEFRADYRVLERGGKRRQKHGEHGAVSFGSDVGADAYSAALFFNNAARDPQSEAGTFLAFRGKEWLEELVAVLRRDAGTVVGHRDRHPGCPGTPVARGTDAQGDFPIRRRGIKRIADDVQQYLAQFAREALDDTVEFVVAVDLDRPVRNLADVDVEHVIGEFRRANFNRPGRFTIERERGTHDVRDAREFRRSLFHECARRRVDAGVVLEQEDQVGDRGQRVVDLVGECAGETADSRQLLVATQRFFDDLALGDVDEGDDAAEGSVHFGDNGRGAHHQRHSLAVRQLHVGGLVDGA